MQKIILKTYYKRITRSAICINYLNIESTAHTETVMAAEIVKSLRAYIKQLKKYILSYFFNAPRTWWRSAVIIRYRVTSCIILIGMVIFSLPRFTSTVFIGFSRPTTFLYSTPEKNVLSLLFEEVTSSELFLPLLSLSFFFIVATTCYCCMFGRISRLKILGEMSFVIIWNSNRRNITLINDTKIRWNSMCELLTTLKLKAQMYKKVSFSMKVPYNANYQSISKSGLFQRCIFLVNMKSIKEISKNVICFALFSFAFIPQ